MKALAFALALMALAGVGYVRLAPSVPARWHVDPRAAAPGEGRFVLRPGEGLPPLAMTPNGLLTELDAIALATPRTTRLAGGPDEGRITYVTRSLIFGFPDYTTVQAVRTDRGTGLAVFARLRFGRGDLGVNRARVESWLESLRARLSV